MSCLKIGTRAPTCLFLLAMVALEAVLGCVNIGIIDTRG